MTEQNQSNCEENTENEFSEEDLAKAKKTTMILYAAMGIGIGAPILAFIFLK